MPETEPTATEMFERAGRTLVPGESWQAGLADLMGVKPASVRQLRSGHLRLRADHFETLLRLLAERQTAMAAAEKQLRDWLAKQPKE